MQLENLGFTGARVFAERGIVAATSDPSSVLVAGADSAGRRDSARVHRVLCEVERALQAAADPILVSGPSGSGKAGLLRALWWAPPKGFTPLFVPLADVEPEVLVAGGLCAQARLLRPQESNAADRLLLVDELQAMPLATLSELVAIAFTPRAALRLVATGTDGDALESAVAALPRSTRRIYFDDSEIHAAAECSAEVEVSAAPLRASAMNAEKRARMMRRRHRRRGLGWI